MRRTIPWRCYLYSRIATAKKTSLKSRFTWIQLPGVN